MIYNSFDLLTEIATLKAKYYFLDIAVKALRFDRDLDLENKVREVGFKLREESFQNDLTTIERKNKELLKFIKIKEKELPYYHDKKTEI